MQESSSQITVMVRIKRTPHLEKCMGIVAGISRLMAYGFYVNKKEQNQHFECYVEHVFSEAGALPLAEDVDFIDFVRIYRCCRMHLKETRATLVADAEDMHDHIHDFFTLRDDEIMCILNNKRPLQIMTSELSYDATMANEIFDRFAAEFVQYRNSMSGMPVCIPNPLAEFIRIRTK